MKEQDYRQLTLFQGDSPANLFPWLESKKEKGTTVTYGRKCLELSENLRRVGYSVRTYLESCELPLPTLYRTWSVKAITSQCLILKLRLSARRTEEKGSPLSENGRLWATPAAGDCIGSTGGGQGRRLRTDTHNTPPNNLWPTCTASETMTERMKSTQQKEGSMHSVGQSDAVRMWPNKLWSTPTQRDYKGSNSMEHLTREISGNRNHADQLANQVKLLPTPRVGGWENNKNGIAHEDLEATIMIAENAQLKSGGAALYGTPTAEMRVRSKKWRGEAKAMAPAEVARMEKEQTGVQGQLNPDWVEWLMGFPAGWTNLTSQE